MIVGVPKEIKNHEYRVGITPSGVGEFVKSGHKLLVEKGVGLGSGFTDDEYASAGATMIDAHKDVYAESEMIYKIKRPPSRGVRPPKRDSVHLLPLRC